MQLNELKRVIEIQQKAFAFLMECKASRRAGSCPLDMEIIRAWEHADTCAEWLTKFLEQIPLSCRPARGEIAAFAMYLSSFLSTSFIAEPIVWGDESWVEIRATAGHRSDGSHKSKWTKAKERDAAELLRKYAFETLALECEILPADNALTALDQDEALAADLTLWAYAEQLVNRSQYASQGPAVYRLWLDLPVKTRRNLSADQVWRARERLIQFLKAN
jgi:hypothetical protein